MFKTLIRNYIGNVGANNETDRQLWVKTALAKLPDGGRILDAGAGEQQYRSCCSHLRYVSQDFCQYEGQGNDRGLQTGAWDVSRIDITSDITAIPEPDASFDAILCTEVFEHIPDPISALNEFHRLLRAGGELILTAPFCSFTHFAPFHFSSGFNRYFYEHHLPKLGFTITEITANGDYSGFEAQELRRLMTYYGKSPLYIKICIAMLLRFIGINRTSSSINIDDLACYGFHVIAVRD